MISAMSLLFMLFSKYEESADVMLSVYLDSEPEFWLAPHESRRINVFLEVDELILCMGLGSLSLRLPSLKKKFFDLESRRSGILGGEIRSPSSLS